MKSIPGSPSPEEQVDNWQNRKDKIALEELEEVLNRTTNALLDADPGQKWQAELERAAEHFRTATGELLDAAERALAELREGRNATRALLDRLEVRLGLHG